MAVFSFHLAKTGLGTALGAFVSPPKSSKVPGLEHAECMWHMQLGASIVSPSRMQLRNVAMFASWKDEDALEAFLSAHALGRALAQGWHVRLQFMRRWGHISEFDGLPRLASGIEQDPALPVVAVTLARMKLPQVPRFIRWGKPVETLVRDHPGATLALAAMRLPRTVSTFSIWRTQQDMTDMVRGHSQVPEPDRHATAMVERNRKDFHFEFTTLRFRCLSEHGEWDGRTKIVPVE